MEIKWLGHSSFLITDSRGVNLLTDPFNNTVGYPVFKGAADIVTISHQHFDHNYVSEIQNSDFQVVDKVGFFNVCDIPVTGIPSFHDNMKGAKRGENTIYVFEMDGFRLCHLGDLGHALDSDSLHQLGKVDVLFVPVGGNYTIDGKTASQVAKAINAHIIIPMHYKTLKHNYPIDGVESFLSFMKNAERAGSSSLHLQGSLTGHNRVVLLQVSDSH